MSICQSKKWVPFENAMDQDFDQFAGGFQDSQDFDMFIKERLDSDR
jgi:hypothetical protein